MKELINILIIIILIGCTDNSKVINNNEQLVCAFEEMVINEGKIGKAYFLNEPVDSGVLERNVIYLGEMTGNKKKYKIVYSEIYSGLYEDSKRANSSIVFYSDKGLRLGQYFIGGVYNNPPVIEAEKLIIKNNMFNCNETTEIDISSEIPKRIFVKCRENNGKMLGDLYEFIKQK